MYLSYNIGIGTHQYVFPCAYLRIVVTTSGGIITMICVCVERLKGTSRRVRVNICTIKESLFGRDRRIKNSKELCR